MKWGMRWLSALQKDAEPVQKITIVPRTMGALGYVLNVPEEEKYLKQQEGAGKPGIIVFLAGRAAEEACVSFRDDRRRKRYREGHRYCPRHGNPVWYV